MPPRCQAKPEGAAADAGAEAAAVDHQGEPPSKEGKIGRLVWTEVTLKL